MSRFSYLIHCSSLAGVVYICSCIYSLTEDTPLPRFMFVCLSAMADSYAVAYTREVMHGFLQGVSIVKVFWSVSSLQKPQYCTCRRHWPKRNLVMAVSFSLMMSDSRCISCSHDTFASIVKHI